ncbi:hypothetical protein ACFV5D_09135, partial [Streptomyces clavifer]
MWPGCSRCAWQESVVAAALPAASTAAATGVLARRLPLMVVRVGPTAGVTMAVAMLTLAFAAAPATDWPLLAVAGSLSAASHAVVAPSARAGRCCGPPGPRAVLVGSRRGGRAGGGRGGVWSGWPLALDPEIVIMDEPTTALD